MLQHKSTLTHSYMMAHNPDMEKDKIPAAALAEIPSNLSNEDDEEVKVDWRTWMAAFSGSACVFAAYYGGLMLGNTGAVVMATFDRPDLAVWMPNAFAIVTASLAGLLGSCSDVIGRKRVLLGGIILSCLGSIVVASAPNGPAAICGSILMSGLFVNQANFYSIPAEVLPRRYRGIGATMTTSMGGFGALLALMFSASTIRDNTGGLSWRSSFILKACLDLAVGALLIFFYRPLESPKEEGVSTWAALRKNVDWLGAFLLIAGLVIILTGMTLGGNSFPWTSGVVIGLLVAGAAILILLALHQLFINKHGILDHDLWTRNFCIGTFGSFVEGIVFFAVLLLFPLETFAFWENRLFYVDVRELLFFVGSALVAPAAGWYTRVTKDLKYPLMAGWLFVLIGFIVLATCDENSNKASMGGLTLVGIGFSTPLALLFAISQLATPPRLLGLTTGQLLASRGIGQAVGASVLVAVYKAKVTSILPAKVSAAVVQAGLPAKDVTAFITALTAQNETLLEAVPDVTPKIIAAGGAAAIQANVKSFHYAWYTALPFSVLALLIVFLLDGKKTKAQMTWLVERPVAVLEHVHHDHHSGKRLSVSVEKQEHAGM